MTVEYEGKKYEVVSYENEAIEVTCFSDGHMTSFPVSDGDIVLVLRPMEEK